MSLRQAGFSVLAIGIAVAVFFGLRGILNVETLSWLCILAASPFAAMGFITYNGMTAEKFAAAWVKSQFILPRHIVSRPVNIYGELLKLDIPEELPNEP